MPRIFALSMSSAMFCLGIIVSSISPNLSYAEHLMDDVNEPLKDFERIRVYQPLIKPIGQENVQLKGFSVGQDLVARTAIQNNHYYSNQTVNYLLITEVRRLSDGITILLNAETGMLGPNDTVSAEVPWTADKEGIFQVRIFAITNDLRSPQILSSVKTAEVSLYNDPDQVKLIVAMEKGSCDGNCHDYTVELYENGIVIYYGRSYVTVQGMHLATVSGDKIDRLLDEFHKLDSSALNYSGPAESDGAPSIKITLNDIGYRGKTIFHRYESSVPSDLLELEKRIDGVLETAKWVYGKEE